MMTPIPQVEETRYIYCCASCDRSFEMFLPVGIDAPPRMACVNCGSPGAKLLGPAAESTPPGGCCPPGTGCCGTPGTS